MELESLDNDALLVSRPRLVSDAESRTRFYHTSASDECQSPQLYSVEQMSYPNEMASFSDNWIDSVGIKDTSSPIQEETYSAMPPQTYEPLALQLPVSVSISNEGSTLAQVSKPVQVSREGKRKQRSSAAKPTALDGGRFKKNAS